MNEQKHSTSPSRLAEFALKNGWSAEEVASTFAVMLGPVQSVDRKPVPSSRIDKASKILRTEFSRLSSKRSR